jgi:class 3 adenylate cyclase
MSSLSLLQEIYRHQKVDYVVCDSARRVADYSPGLIRYIQRSSGPLRGQPLDRLFDLFSGMEKDLDQVAAGQLPELAIEKIHAPAGEQAGTYFSLRIFPYLQGLLVLVVDVTEEAILEQRVTQQRNELDLLSGQLVRSRAQLDDLLHRFVPTRIADKIVSRPQQVQLGGEKRFISVLFADMRSFTQLAEILSPENLLDLLNQHFGILGEVLTQHGGVITNYGGDMVMAVFNALADQPDHALQAVRAGLEIQKTLQHLFENPRSGMPFVFDFGVGINSGWGVVGYLGYENRLEYTALGETINIASRFSGIARAGQVLLGETTWQLAAGKIRTVCLGDVTLRGRDEPVLAYEAVDVED